MAVFHFTTSIVGRSRGRPIISASAYLNGDVMKDEETGKTVYYTKKREVIFTDLMMCENAPPEWAAVPEKDIKRFMQSVRYKRAEDKPAAVEKYKMTFRKQRLWNEVLKKETGSDAQLGRLFEFSLPREWSREEQIRYTSEYIRKTFVEKGMCADWAIHDKGDGNPHVHMLVTMRPFKEDRSWGNKEVKDWAFVRDKDGDIVIDESHPDWWQDKKNPDRHGIRIPVLDEDGNQKVGARNRKQWKRELTDSTGWNSPKNCEAWREEWANTCNCHLAPELQVDHRSYERQGKMIIPQIHEGAQARKIEEKYLNGRLQSPSYKVEENRLIRNQNALLSKIQDAFRKVSMALTEWKEWINDYRREQGNYSHDDRHDQSNRRTADTPEGDASGAAVEGRGTGTKPGAESAVGEIKQRFIRAAEKFSRYRKHALPGGGAGREDHRARSKLSEMAVISAEAEQRERIAAETEQRIAEIDQRIKKGRETDERIRVLMQRYAVGDTPSDHRPDAGRDRGERPSDHGAEETTRRLDAIKREFEQREQGRGRKSIKRRLEEKKQLVEERKGKSKGRQSCEIETSL